VFLSRFQIQIIPPSLCCVGLVHIEFLIWLQLGPLVEGGVDVPRISQSLDPMIPSLKINQVGICKVSLHSHKNKNIIVETQALVVAFSDFP
jgi:hypothetical protein